MSLGYRILESVGGNSIVDVYGLGHLGWTESCYQKRRFPVQGRGDKVSVSYDEVKEFGDEEP